MRLKMMILSMKVLLLGAAVTTATATATAQGTTRTTGTERTVHAGDYVTTITVDGTATTITNDVKSVTAAPGAKVKVTAAPPQQGKRARLVITKAASSSSGQTQSGTVTKVEVKGQGDATTVDINRILQMVATVDGTGDYNKTVTWYVEDLDASGEILKGSQKYATINDNGQLLGKAAGKVRVYAKSDYDPSVEGYCDIQVGDPNPQQQTGENPGGQGTGQDTPVSAHNLKIIVPGNVTQIRIIDSITLSATDNGNTAFVTWSVNGIGPNPGSATINSDGQLSLKETGTVCVTATLEGLVNVTAYQVFEILP